jgi:exopolyphosphatase/guanosine-5'-triphosphate,3'-diphosphate pyrophosphatase
VRTAGIDCGTNSIRLLVADVDGGRLTDVVREMRIVRLGQGVDRTGRLAPEALERTRAALADYAATIRATGAERVRMVATSATRDAQNRDEFVELVRAELGVPPEVISGAEEAALSYAGAASVLDFAAGPVLVADIGGGSTELVRGGDGGALSAFSMDVGCVRMTERHLHDDPPTPAQVAALRADVDAALAGARVDPASAGTVVGVAGTVTTVAAGVLGLPAYDRSRIHLARLARADVHATVLALVQMSVDERRALGYMHPGRADVIGAGALILDRVLERTTVDDLIVSESDILDGIAWSTVAAIREGS